MSTSDSTRLGLAAEPLLHPLPAAGDLDPEQLDLPAAGRGVQGGIAVPLDEVGQLRVGQQVQHAELVPGQQLAVRQVSLSLDRRPADPLLEPVEVVHRDHPAQPAAALGAPGPHRLAERCLVRGRVVEHVDHLQVAASGQRQDVVPGAEPRVQPPVPELDAHPLTQPLRRPRQPFGSSREGQVIQVHADIVAVRVSGFSPRASAPGRPGGAAAGRGGTRTRRTDRPARRTPRAPSARSARPGSSHRPGWLPWWASVLELQYQSRSAPPGPQPSRPYSPMLTSV